MNTIQIQNVLMNDNIVANQFLGVFASDHIPNSILKYPCCFVVNTAPSSHPGKHWIAIYINPFGYAFYFCSYAKPPNKLIKSFLNNKFYNKWINVVNSFPLQSLFTNVCGQYCIVFLNRMCLSMGDHTKVMKSFLQIEDSHKRDIAVQDFVNKRYDLKTKFFNIEVFVQIATIMGN